MPILKIQLGDASLCCSTYSEAEGREIAKAHIFGLQVGNTPSCCVAYRVLSDCSLAFAKRRLAIVPPRACCRRILFSRGDVNQRCAIIVVAFC
jgi:hypothetical protein